MAGEREDNTNEAFTKDGKKINRQKCNVYTRVMGYLRPVWFYNIWKKTEFYSRVYFKEWCLCKRDFDRIQANRDFITKYSNEQEETVTEQKEFTPYRLTV